MTLTNNVSNVGFNCIVCGACKGVCPKHCIDIVEVGRIGSKPIIDMSRCINCNLCLVVCPVNDINKKEEISRSMKIYTGISKNHDIYYNGASGGIVSSILIYLFEKNKIDAAIVTFYNENFDLYGDIITGNEDVLKHSGSFYLPVQQLVNIKKIKNYKSVAFVGLPCHILAMDRIIKLMGLKNIYIKIALFCGGRGRMKRGTIDLIKFKYGHSLRKNEKILEYHSRRGEKRLLSKIEILTNFEKYEFLYPEFLSFVDYYYYLNGCYNCKRIYGIDADISVGDDWSNDADTKLAIVSCNSKLGIDVIKDNYLLQINESNLNSLIKSQSLAYTMKYIWMDKIVTRFLLITLFKVIKLLGYLNFHFILGIFRYININRKNTLGKLYLQGLKNSK